MRIILAIVTILITGCSLRPSGKDMSFLNAQDLDGKRVSFHDELGELTFVTFWASWCKSCKLELDALNYLGSLHYHRGVKVIGVSIDETREAARAAASRKNLDYITLLVDENKSVQNAFRVGSVPITIVLDKSGSVISFPDPETGVLSESIAGLKPWGNALSSNAVREALEKNSLLTSYLVNRSFSSFATQDPSLRSG